MIEDNVEVAKWIKDKISEFGNLELAGISNTYNGAFEMIKSEEPQLVILDLKLPDGNGINILKKIRNAKLNITVMVLSLNVQSKNVCLRIGADYFFDKSKELIFCWRNLSILPACKMAISKSKTG